MSRFKILYVEGGAVGNRFITTIEAENGEQAQYLFYMKYGAGYSIESITIVEDDDD